jgi:hypothetical protein
MSEVEKLKHQINNITNENKELSEANRVYLDRIESDQKEIKELEEVCNLLISANVKQAIANLTKPIMSSEAVATQIQGRSWKEVNPDGVYYPKNQMVTGWYWLGSEISGRLIWYVEPCQKQEGWCFYHTDRYQYHVEESTLRPYKRVHDLVERSGLGWKWEPFTNTEEKTTPEKIQIREGLWLTRGMRKVHIRKYVDFFNPQQFLDCLDSDRCWTGGDGLVLRRDGRYRDSGLHPHDLVKFLGEVFPLLDTKLRTGLWRSRNNKEFRIYHDDRDIQYPWTDGVETWTNEGLYFKSKNHYLDLILYTGD